MELFQAGACLRVGRGKGGGLEARRCPLHVASLGMAVDGRCQVALCAITGPAPAAGGSGGRFFRAYRLVA